MTRTTVRYLAFSLTSHCVSHCLSLPLHTAHTCTHTRAHTHTHTHYTTHTQRSCVCARCRSERKDVIKLAMNYCKVRGPTTWTITLCDGPNHLGLWYNALPEHQMSLITSSGCVPFSTHWSSGRSCMRSPPTSPKRWCRRPRAASQPPSSLPPQPPLMHTMELAWPPLMWLPAAAPTHPQRRQAAAGGGSVGHAG